VRTIQETWLSLTGRAPRHITVLPEITLSQKTRQLWQAVVSTSMDFDLDVVSLYQDGGRGRSILFLVSHLLMSLPSEGQSLWANQILSTYLNWWLRYNYFRFCKRNVRHIGNLLSVSISTICQKSAHYSASGNTELCPNRSTHCGNVTSYPFLKMAAATAEYYFRFRICWCHCLQKVKVY